MMDVSFVIRVLPLFFAFTVFSSCFSGRYLVETGFYDSPVPPPPNYTLSSSWASLPDKKDPADSVPDKGLHDQQAIADIDVFFIHPTIYTYKPGTPYKWNGDVNDPKLNKAADQSTILYQASIFNQSCKIYAPRYRQAHISAFYTKNKADAKAALDLAYSDVKTAFQYYLDHYNNGKPFIIAAHSQGTLHAYHLLEDNFKEGTLKNRLVAAYLVGMPINPDSLSFIPPCNSPDQTACYCTWNTFSRNYYPSYYEDGLVHAICTNPLSWSCDSTYVAASLNKGGVLRDFEKLYPGLCDAQVHEGMLWINKPDFPGKSFLNIKIWHIADYNLFYMNIQENVQRRINAFWKR
jgi:hypothetical protein